MENNKPDWWDRYFTPWSKEHNDFYEENKNQIFKMEKNMDWEKGIRDVTYFGNGFKQKFEETF